MNKSLELLKKTKKANLDVSMLVDVWLEEFFNTTISVLKTDKRFYNKDGTEKDDISRKFYKAYQVTEEQHDWWENLMFEIMPKVLKVSKAYFKRGWWSLSLNSAPSVKNLKK